MYFRLYIALGLLTVLAIGFFRIRHIMSRLEDKMEFLTSYLNDYTAMLNGLVDDQYGFIRSSVNDKLYNRLMVDSVKTQRMLGVHGMGTFIAPLNGHKISNYKYVINTLSKIPDQIISDNELNQVHNSILRCLGVFLNEHEELRDMRFNPLRWFQYGIRYLIALPVLTLNWFGLISEHTSSRLSHNWLFKVTSAIVTLISVAAAVVGLVVGWEDFVQIVGGFRNW